VLALLQRAQAANPLGALSRPVTSGFTLYMVTIIEIYSVKLVTSWHRRTSVFAQEVDGARTDGMLFNRRSNRLLSHHLEL
jgi:hypothetical protein